MFIIKIFKNRNFIFILAFIPGLPIGHLGSWIKHLTLPALAIVMVVSLTQISIRSFLPLKSMIKPVLLTVVLNYLVFAFVMLAMAWFFIPERELWIGFVIIAFAPPGVAVAPFTSILGGDIKFSLAGVIEVNGVFGKYDVFVKVSAENPDTMAKMVSQIRKIKVIRSHTLPVVYGQGGTIDK